MLVTRAGRREEVDLSNGCGDLVFFFFFFFYSFYWSVVVLPHCVSFCNTAKGISPMYTYQFSSVAQSCPTLCDPMNHSTPGLPVHYQLLESANMLCFSQIFLSLFGYTSHSCSMQTQLQHVGSSSLTRD